jgi:hypothetical protein
LGSHYRSGSFAVGAVLLLAVAADFALIFRTPE